MCRNVSLADLVSIIPENLRPTSDQIERILEEYSEKEGTIEIGLDDDIDTSVCCQHIIDFWENYLLVPYRDVPDYTKLMEEDTEGTVAAWSEARDKVVEPQVESAKGRLVKFMGDGFLAEFTTVQTALECAIAIQNGVKDNKLKFRIAVHLGDIIDDGKDIYGEGINIASRLEGIAEPGGICISGDVYNQVRNRIPAEYEDIGPQEVKNVAETQKNELQYLKSELEKEMIKIFQNFEQKNRKNFA